MAKLTYEKRKKMAASKFAEPKKRKYPIEDKSHARNALARVSEYGDKSEKKKVRSAVEKKYPSIKVSKK